MLLAIVCLGALTPAPARAQAADHWRFFTARDGLTESFVAAVVPASDGRVWISHGVVDRVSRFDGHVVTHLPSPGELSPVLQAPDGQLWSVSGRARADVMRFSAGTWQTYALPAGPGPLDLTHRVVPLDRDQVAVALPEGVATFDARTGAMTRDPRLPAAILPLVGLIRARSGDLLAVGSLGVARRSPAGTWRVDLVPARLGQVLAGRVFESDAGALWLTARDARSNRDSVVRAGASGWAVMAQARTPFERLTAWPGAGDSWWLAREQEGGFRIAWMTTHGEQLVPNARVLTGRLQDVAVQPDGVFWLATSLGAARDAPPTWQPVPGVAASELVNALEVAPGGALVRAPWIVRPHQGFR